MDSWKQSYRVSIGHAIFKEHRNLWRMSTPYPIRSISECSLKELRDFFEHAIFSISTARHMVWRMADMNVIILAVSTCALRASPSYLDAFFYTSLKHRSITNGIIIAPSFLINHTLGECRIPLQSSMAG